MYFLQAQRMEAPPAHTLTREFPDDDGSGDDAQSDDSYIHRKLKILH
jgi:hypothetical protein